MTLRLKLQSRWGGTASSGSGAGTFAGQQGRPGCPDEAFKAKGRSRALLSVQGALGGG